MTANTLVNFHDATFNPVDESGLISTISALVVHSSMIQL